MLYGIIKLQSRYYYIYDKVKEIWTYAVPRTHMIDLCTTCLACLSLQNENITNISHAHATPPYFTMLASTSGVLM